MNSNYPFEPLAEGARNKRKVHCRGCNKPLGPGEAEYVCGYRCPTCVEAARLKARDYDAGEIIERMIDPGDPDRRDVCFNISILQPGVMVKALAFLTDLIATFPALKVTGKLVRDVKRMAMGRDIDLHIEIPLGGAQ